MNELLARIVDAHGRMDGCDDTKKLRFSTGAVTKSST
jgi:hypothetical protein